LTIFKLLSGVGIVVLIIGIIIAAVPFKEEIMPTEHVVQISDWTVSWYYAPVKPTEELFAGVFIGNSTFEPFFARTYPAYSEVFGGLVEQVGFIAKAYIEVPIDGYVRFSVSGGDGTCIKFYIDGNLTVDMWERTGQASETEFATVELKTGIHELKLWWYREGTQWSSLGFSMDQNVMVFTRKSDPPTGLGVACAGVILMALAKFKARSLKLATRK